VNVDKTEILILKNLIFNDDYTRKVLPFLKLDYFQDYSQRVIFEEIGEFINDYNKLPSLDALEIELERRTDLNESSFSEINTLLYSLEYEQVSQEWLIDTTERWCKDRAIYLALMESLQIANGSNEQKGRDAIPSILQDALAVSFDNHIGHDYFENSDARFEYYHDVENKIPFDIERLNTITKGGIKKKTLNIIMGTTNAGKSICLCSFASGYLRQGKNVLYITLEMSEEEIAKRIDANVLDLNIDTIATVHKKVFDDKIQHLRNRTNGQLIIKEYPTGGASVNNFRALLNELDLKKKFVPDIIIVDYLSICASSRYKKGFSNSYEYVGSVAEELRGLAKEFDVPLWSAIQSNRDQQANTDPTLAGISESAKIGHVSDFLCAIISNEELEQLGQYMFKQIKNRYNQKSKLTRFVVGIDYTKMRLYDVENDENQIQNYSDEEETEMPDLKAKFKTFNFN
jgi:replicative DNA helicase